MLVRLVAQPALSAMLVERWQPARIPTCFFFSNLINPFFSVCHTDNFPKNTLRGQTSLHAFTAVHLSAINCVALLCDFVCITLNITTGGGFLCAAVELRAQRHGLAQGFLSIYTQPSLEVFLCNIGTRNSRK